MRLPALALGVALLCVSGCRCGSVVITGSDDGGDAGGGTVADGGGGGQGDAGGGPDGGGPCGASTCPAPNVCRFGVCVDLPPACTADAECQADSYCESGECIPYGVGPRGASNPSCRRLTVVGLFAPKALCEWKAPPAGDPYPAHVNVLSTPLVADFDFDNNTATVKPSIVFTTYNCSDGACGAQPGCYGVIRVIDGQTCQLQHNVGGTGGDTQIIGDVTPAIGDIDGDKRPDIVTEHIGGGVMGFTFLALAGTPHFAPLWTTYASFNAAGCHWDSLSLHDLDDDGVPEIVQNGPFPAVYSNTGVLIDGSAVDTTYGQMLHPVLADLDGDGQIELVDGRGTFRFDKTTKKWAVASTTANALGQVAIADFGTFGASAALDNRAVLDGVPELAVVSSGSVRVQTLGGRVIFGPVALPGAGNGGAPTVADFDGDTRAEVGVAGAAAYSVFDLDCIPAGVSTTCPSGAVNGVLWSKVSQDASSNVTGSSVFDFEADGNAEVVYADECFSRVYSGSTGEVLFSQYHTSCTWFENPIVADVNGDFRSEVVIPSNDNCGVGCPALDPVHDGVRCETGADCPGATTCGREVATDKYGRCRCTQTADCASPSLSCADRIAGPSAAGMVCRAFHPTGAPQHGVLVLHDVLDRWVSSRPIWNQHAYSVTNVNDDGTIPRTSLWKQNWKQPGLNNFRMNVQGSASPENSPDLTSGKNGPPGGPPPIACVDGTLKLQAKVCNRGTGPVAAGVPVSFYKGVPAPAGRICTATTTQTLDSGECEVVGCDWPAADPGPTDVTVVADDDGTAHGVASECLEQNNRMVLKGLTCGTIG